MAKQNYCGKRWMKSMDATSHYNQIYGDKPIIMIILTTLDQLIKYLHYWWCMPCIHLTVCTTYFSSIHMILSKCSMQIWNTIHKNQCLFLPSTSGYEIAGETAYLINQKIYSKYLVFFSISLISSMSYFSNNTSVSTSRATAPDKTS